MPQKKRGKRRPAAKYVYNDASPRNLGLGAPAPVAPVDAVKDEGTIKALLIGKLGSRGYGRLLAGLREVSAE